MPRPARSSAAAAAAPAVPGVLRSPLLEGLPWLAHGFSTRRHGPSGADFDLSRSLPNQRRFARGLLGRSAPLPLQLRQIHSALVWNADRADTAGRAGDAMIARQPGSLLAIRTADCCPILLADVRRRAIAAVHAGWRGTLARIAEKTVGEMRAAFGTDPADLRALLGPCIHACCYEVGEDLHQAFHARFDYAAELFQAAEDDPVRNRYPMLFLTGAPPGHPYDPRWNPTTPLRLDLVLANRRQLQAAGLSAPHIEAVPFCTACHPERFFSYRRGATGRMLSAIAIKKDHMLAFPDQGAVT